MKFKTFLIGILLVALVASIYSAPKSLLINIAFKGTPSPYNTNWVGSSDLYKLLEKENYTVYAPLSWSQLLDDIGKSPGRIVVLVFISPDYPITRDEAEALENTLREAGVEHGFSLLVADENTTSNNVLRKTGIMVTGQIIKGPGGSVYDLAFLSIPSGMKFSLNGTLEGQGQSIRLNNVYPLTLSIASTVATNHTSDAIISRDYMNNVVGVYYTPGTNTGLPYRHIAVFGDGTIFLNTAIRHSTENENYTSFILDLFRDLSDYTDPSNVTVIIDSSHYYSPIKNIGGSNVKNMAESYVKLPLPLMLHPAILTYFLLLLEKTGENQLITYLREMPLLGVPVVGLAAYIAYRLLKMGFPYSYVDDDEEREVREVSVLTQSKFRETLVSSRKLRKKDAREALYNLYYTMNMVLKDHLSVTLEELAGDPEKAEMAARVLGLDPLFLSGFARWMVLFRDKYEGKRRFTPIIISWKRTLERRAGEAEVILEKLGFTLGESREGLKGVEYGVRKF